jgi:hypothetical protein
MGGVEASVGALDSVMATVTAIPFLDLNHPWVLLKIIVDQDER